MKLLRDVQHIEVMEAIGKPRPAPKAKKAKNPPINKAAILAKRVVYLCDCGCGYPGQDLHHAIIGRRKGYPILDDERNLVLVEHYEHVSGMFDNREWRLKFWRLQCKRYGEKKMFEWVDAVLAAGLDKSRIDWL